MKISQCQCDNRGVIGVKLIYRPTHLLKRRINKFVVACCVVVTSATLVGDTVSIAVCLFVCLFVSMKNMG